MLGSKFSGEKGGDKVLKDHWPGDVGELDNGEEARGDRFSQGMGESGELLGNTWPEECFLMWCLSVTFCLNTSPVADALSSQFEEQPRSAFSP